MKAAQDAETSSSTPSTSAAGDSGGLGAFPVHVCCVVVLSSHFVVLLQVVLWPVLPTAGSLFHEDDTSGFADQFHVAFQQQNRTLTAQLERVGVALIDLSIQDW